MCVKNLTANHFEKLLKKIPRLPLQTDSGIPFLGGISVTSETRASFLGKMRLHSSAATTFSNGFSPNSITHSRTPRLQI